MARAKKCRGKVDYLRIMSRMIFILDNYSFTAGYQALIFLINKDFLSINLEKGHRQTQIIHFVHKSSSLFHFHYKQKVFHSV